MWKGLKLKILAPQILKIHVLICGFLLYSGTSGNFAIFKAIMNQGRSPDVFVGLTSTGTSGARGRQISVFQKYQ